MSASGYGKVKPAKKRQSRAGVKQQRFVGAQTPLRKKTKESKKVVAQPKTSSVKAIKNDNPYHNRGTFPHVTLEGAIIEKPKDNQLMVTYDNPTFLDLIAYSKLGVNLSQNTSTIYIRLEQDEVKDGKPYKEKSLGHFLREIDDFAWESWKILESTLKAEFGEEVGGINGSSVVLEGGKKECDSKSRNLNLIEYAMFPHRQWTKVYEFNIENQKTVSKHIEFLLSNSAVSTFLFSTKVKKVKFSAEGEVLRVCPYISVDTMTWVNNGQDCKAALEDLKAEREEENEGRRLNKIQGLSELFMRSMAADVDSSSGGSSSSSMSASSVDESVDENVK